MNNCVCRIYNNGNGTNNYIIGGFGFGEYEQKIRIINSYEQINREPSHWKHYKKENENEKEIKENCEIRINDKVIPFSYFYNFNNKKKVNILLNIFLNKI